MSKATCLINCKIGDTIYYIRRGYTETGKVVDKIYYRLLTPSNRIRVDFPAGHYPVVESDNDNVLVNLHPFNYFVEKIIKKCQ